MNPDATSPGFATSRGRPSTAALAAAVREHLQTEIQPRLDGAAAYRNRVAQSLLRIIEREAQRPASETEGERARLAQHLGFDGPRDALDAELCRRIRSGSLDWNNLDLLDLLDALAIAQLEIDNPAYPTLARARGS